MPIAPLAISMPPTSVMISSAYFGKRRQRRVIRRSRAQQGVSDGVEVASSAAAGPLRRARTRPSTASCGSGAAGSGVVPSVLPSSTPHWSKLSMPHTAPDVKTRCS